MDVQAGPGDRDAGDALGQVLVPSQGGPGVPLTQVATFEQGSGPSVINRWGRQRSVTLMANAAPGTAIALQPARVSLPAEVHTLQRHQRPRRDRRLRQPW